MRNRLHDAGFHASRPSVGILLTRNYGRARVDWCEEHLSWEEADWDPALLTDESKFFLDFTNGWICRTRVLRWENEHYSDAAIEDYDRIDRNGGGSRMD